MINLDMLCNMKEDDIFAGGMWNFPLSQPVGFEWKGGAIGLVDNMKRFIQPYYYFQNYWSHEILVRLCKYTNIYASTFPEIRKWTPLCVDKMRLFLRICIMIGLKKISSYRLHWSKNYYERTPEITRAMTRKQYEAIVRCLHWNIYLAHVTNIGWLSNQEQTLAHFRDQFTSTITCNWTPLEE